MKKGKEEKREEFLCWDRTGALTIELGGQNHCVVPVICDENNGKKIMQVHIYYRFRVTASELRSLKKR